MIDKLPAQTSPQLASWKGKRWARHRVLLPASWQKHSASFTHRHCHANATPPAGGIRFGRRQHGQNCRSKGTECPFMNGRRAVAFRGNFRQFDACFRCIFEPGQLPCRRHAFSVHAAGTHHAASRSGGVASVLLKRNIAVRPGTRTIRQQTESRRSWIDEIRIPSSSAA